MSRTPDPIKVLMSACRELMVKLHRKHKPREWGGRQLKELSLEELQALKPELRAEIDKQTIISQIRELTPGKRNGKALDQFTLEQLRTHLAKLMGETTPQTPPVAYPVPHGAINPTDLTLSITFPSLEALAAFCERMKEPNHA